MRTTLDIDDDVLLAVKDIARRKNSTAGEVISERVRQALTNATNIPSAVAEPKGFNGFNPLPAEGRVVSNVTVDKLREDEGVWCEPCWMSMS